MSGKSSWDKITRALTAVYHAHVDRQLRRAHLASSMLRQISLLLGDD
jgi:hypothetical protein